MSKRLLGLFLAFALILCGLPAMALAAEADLSANVKVSEFRFLVEGAKTTKLTPGATVTAECSIERTAAGSGAQSYSFLIQVIDNGRLIDLKKTEGTISVKDGKQKLRVSTGKLGADTSKYEIVALLVADTTYMAPLSMPANFNNGSCDLASITVAGYPVPLEAGKTEYSMNLAVLEEELPPKIEVLPFDLSTGITVKNIDGNSGTATVTAVSHNRQATAEYKLNLNIQPMQHASLKSVTVDGKPLAGFTPNVTDYRIDPPSENAVPVIAFEKALDSTEVTVIPAAELPGTTVIQTKAADGSELTYKFTFTKTVEITASDIARSIDFNGYKVLQLASDPADFLNFQQVAADRPNGPSGQDYTYGTKGQMMLIKGTYGYFGFKAGLPADAKIEKGEVTFTLLAEDREDPAGSGKQRYGKLHLDVYGNTDTSWTELATGEYREGAIKPAYTSTVINNESDIPAQLAKQTYEQTITYQLDPAGLQGRSMIGLAAETRENSSSYNSFITIPVNTTEKLPKLKLTYYKDYVEPENLEAVTFDGEAFAGFQPDVYEYKIPSADGQTAAPVIAATAGDPATRVEIQQADTFPGRAVITTTAQSGESKTYTFLFMKTVEITPYAAAASFGTGTPSVRHLGVAKDGEIGTYYYDTKLDGSGYARITQPGKIFTGSENGNMDDRAYLAFAPRLPIDAVIDSAQLDLSVMAAGKAQHIDLYQNTQTAWTKNATGTTEAAAPAFDSGKRLNNDMAVKADGKNYYPYTYDIDPAAIVSGNTVLTAITRETASWSDYAVLDLRNQPPVLRVNYYREPIPAEEGQVSAVNIGGEPLEGFSPEQYEYIIDTEVGETQEPALDYALAAGTTATYTPAADLPGTATIVTSGGLTYKFKFAKTVEVKAFSAAKVYAGSKKMGVGTVENDFKIQFDNMSQWNRDGDILTIMGGSDGRAYLAFRPELPEGANVEDASLLLYIQGSDKQSKYNGIVHLDFYQNTDTAWTEKAQGHYEIEGAPAYGNTVLNSEVAVKAGDTYEPVVYAINPSAIQGQKIVSLAGVSRELSNGYDTFSIIRLKEGKTPILTITYTLDD